MKIKEAAIEYLEYGWSVIPIRRDTKRPCVRWKEYQERLASDQEVDEWFDHWPDAQLALVTGQLSGVVVVDCDNEDALKSALSCGMRSAITANTKRGKHLFFQHPKDGTRRGPRAGGNSTGTDWPRINGLDFRGDGSYALLAPSDNYEWSIPPELDRHDDMPIWEDAWRPSVGSGIESDYTFEHLNLQDVRLDAENMLTEWERTESHVKANNFPDNKIPTGEGNARNERVMRYASEQILNGLFGAELRVRCRQYMSVFFADHLPTKEFEDTLNSVEQMERRNHPERFDPDGNYIYNRPEVVVRDGQIKERRLIHFDDAEKLIEAGKSRQYFLEPWLRPMTIIQVHGYSGSGKTMFVQHACYALAAGARYFGPYEITKPARVLYMDWELSTGDLGRRLSDLKSMYGDAEDRFAVWTPWLDDQEINLRTAGGLNELQSWIQYQSPDVVVLDTIRTAFSGLSENSADEWAQVNSMALRLRNAGMSVVMLHHSNKPGEDGLGREAGSTNQLTVLETQIRIAQLYREEETAKSKAGLWDGKYETSPMDQLEKKIDDDWYLAMAMEVRYGKVREWTDLHDNLSYIGWATHKVSGAKKLVSSF